MDTVELKNKVLELQKSLLDRHPSMPGLLREIHVALKKQPENVTLLEETEINIVVQGLEKQTGYEIASTVSKPKSSSTGLKNKIASKGADAF